MWGNFEHHRALYLGEGRCRIHLHAKPIRLLPDDWITVIEVENLRIFAVRHGLAAAEDAAWNFISLPVIAIGVNPTSFLAAHFITAKVIEEIVCAW